MLSLKTLLVLYYLECDNAGILSLKLDILKKKNSNFFKVNIIMEKITSRIGPVSLSFLLLFTYLVKGDIFELRDIKFDSNYNKYELPPSHDGKPLLVSTLA